MGQLVIDGWTTYANASHRFTLARPASWTVVENALGCAVVLLEAAAPTLGFRPNLNVVVSDVAVATDLEKLVAAQQETMRKTLTDFKVLDVESLPLAGQPGRHLRGGYRQGTYRLTTEAWTFIKDKRGFTVVATYDERDGRRVAATVRRVAESVAVNK